MKKKLIIALVAVLILILMLVAIIRKRKRELAEMKGPKKYVTVVQVAPVKEGSIEISSAYLGEIVPVTETEVASKVSGFIEQVFVDDGANVKAGDNLVKIDDRDIRDRIASINARISATKSNLNALAAKIPGLQSSVYTNKAIFERNRVLYENKAIGREELDISNKNYQLAVSELQATQQSINALKSTIASLESEEKAEEVLLSYTTITSPFTGIVQRKILSVGDIATPGKPILTLVRPEAGVKVVVRVAPEDFAKIRTGTGALLVFNGKSVAAKVTSLYPATSPNNLGICNIPLRESPFHLPFHTKIEVKLVTRKITGLVAPSSCLLRQGDRNLVVEVNKKNVARVVPVKLLGKNESRFCFVSRGIKEGSRLASARESRLMRIFTGQRVEVVK